MQQAVHNADGEHVISILNRDGASSFVLVCEHASNNIPDKFDDLGLEPEVRQSHVAWDPGARWVSEALSDLLDCPLVVSEISRLVYDCNRPPDAESAMPVESEIFSIPGNRHLTSAQKSKRVANYYRPFEAAVGEVLSDAGLDAVLVTIHSFTPAYHGQQRDVELGILHDADSRLADALMAQASEVGSLNVKYNQPYGATDGVTHTLQLHGVGKNILNVMIEIRNDLLETTEQARMIAELLVNMLTKAMQELRTPAKRTGT